jgi:hypothetical protein
VKPAAGLHPNAQTQRTRLAYREMCGEASEQQRAAEIEVLPVVEWKGRTLRTLRCRGSSGRGPHDVHVPEALLWSLIDLRAYRCPYHVTSELAAEGTEKGR